MTKQSVMLGVASLVLVGVIIAPQETFAYKGDPNVNGPNYTVERHEAMEKAFENNNYNAWKVLMNGQGRVTQVINAQNFSRFAQAHQLADQGRVSEANTIRSELGLGLQNGSRRSQGTGRGMSR